MKGLISLAELFILISILFLIQTVVNYASHSGEQDTKVEDYVVLSISQVPSGGHFIDHIRSLQIGSQLMIFNPQGCNPRFGPPPPHPNVAAFKSSEGDRCESFSPNVRKEYIGQNKDEVSKFVEAVEVLSRVDVAFSNTEGKATGSQRWPIDITISFRPVELEDDVSISVSYCLCGLLSDATTLRAPSIWNLNTTELVKPHPVVVRGTLVSDRLQRGLHLDYFHYSAPNNNGELSQAFKVTRYDLHAESSCPKKSRADAVRVIEISANKIDL
ncbi:hypothetical protein FDP08_02185 [Marinobacter panjinensis]|uniref:Uncharacterized protein n=1 Tax=Marinobacter panjinensis TaxID=2576384 RepID=A0A4U6R2F8_9GAMM|nr:hypothetical protein [Marinobacter panjinensis]TKV66978.1 hypothetical protein FDP08_02185 [Marinobacter panjinensis]